MLPHHHQDKPDRHMWIYINTYIYIYICIFPIKSEPYRFRSMLVLAVCSIMVTRHKLPLIDQAPGRPKFPKATLLPTRFCDISTCDSCWMTAKGSSFKKEFLHSHYFPYRSPTESRTPATRRLISSLSCLLQVFPMPFLQRRRRFTVFQESWWQVNQSRS